MRRKIAICIFTLIFWASLIALGWLYDADAVAISCAAHLAMVGLIICSENNENAETPEHDSCDGCKHDLGGGRCRMNLEYECREGGGFELWEDDEE